jgi:geranylgeranyl transferase type-2 subunit beta
MDGKMEQSVLARLDGQIAWTARQWPHQMRQRLAGYILAQQTAGGGFTDKAGSPDLYYTGWALRGLWLIGGIDQRTSSS